MLPVWKVEGCYLCANTFPDTGIPMSIRIKRFRYFLSLASVWTVWSFILLKEAIRAGLGGMMVGHLQVPVIEPIGGLPSSLSRNVVYDLLTDELAFKGLIFTDALAMKGVAGNGNVSLQALKAGNDMVLSPPKT